VQLGVQQVHLTQIRLRWILRHSRAMFYRHAGMRIAFDTESCEQANAQGVFLAEGMGAAEINGGDGGGHGVEFETMEADLIKARLDLTIGPITVVVASHALLNQFPEGHLGEREPEFESGSVTSVPGEEAVHRLRTRLSR